jgi:hypothetical protein
MDKSPRQASTCCWCCKLVLCCLPFAFYERKRLLVDGRETSERSGDKSVGTPWRGMLVIHSCALIWNLVELVCVWYYLQTKLVSRAQNYFICDHACMPFLFCDKTRPTLRSCRRLLLVSSLSSSHSFQVQTLNKRPYKTKQHGPNQASK